MSETYWLITTNGEIQKIESPGVMPLAKMQELVGGHIEFTKIGVVVGVTPVDLDAVVNQEGLLIPLPVNRLYPHLAGNILLGRCAHSEEPLNGLEFFGVESETLGELMPVPKEKPYHDKQ